MTQPEYEELLKRCEKECIPVHDWVKKMGYLCANSCRKLLAPFCSSLPLCGSFQLYKDVDAQEALLNVLSGAVDIRDSTEASHFSLIKKSVPLLADAIVENMEGNGKLSECATRVIEYIVTHVIELLSECEVPASDRYGEPTESAYEFFPCFPSKLGKSYYAIDTQKNNDDVHCRKLSNSHPVLSPGIFTMFCRHRICLGFSLMMTTESPRTPFEILLRRFPDYLSQLRIVYDNCCNLHQFALNREPARFAETLFMIDRLHFQDHVSCTLGYSTNSYNYDPHVKSLNTQINEQANSDLRNLSKQIAYMKPENVILHLKIFLVERNNHKY